MIEKRELIKFVIGAVVLLSMAFLFVSIGYGIWDSTNARATNEKVAEQRAEGATRRIDSQQMQLSELNKKLSESEYLRGKAEATCPVVGHG